MAGHDRPQLPHGATCAISLSFDGGLIDHVELVAPILRDADIRATFFVTAPAVLERPRDWQSIAEFGHEIASHAHYGVADQGNLPLWGREAVREDLIESNRGIAVVTGYVPTSYAKAGLHAQCADGEYGSELGMYAAIRSASIGVNNLLTASPRDVVCIPWGHLGHIDQSIPKAGEWTVPVFERFFDPFSARAEDDLRALVATLRQRSDIWVAPFGEVATTLPRWRDSR